MFVIINFKKGKHPLIEKLNNVSKLFSKLPSLISYTNNQHLESENHESYINTFV